ncbi:MAG TPA: peptidase [Rhodospirillaceae bacterium]|nr:peptidase [Rhodospirillaceae bacterium]
MFDCVLFNKVLGTADFASPNLLFVFGLFLMLGVLGATVAHKVKWLPTITAFMLIGIAIGPSGADLISTEILHKSSAIIDVALGLILYKLGSEVQLRHLLRSTPIWRSSLLEAAMTFVCSFVVMSLFGVSMVIAALVSAIVVSSSPAVLVHMADEMRAKGPVVYHAKALVALNNVLAFFAFSLLLPFVLGETQFHWLDVLGIPFYRAVGAALIGLVVALIMERVDRTLNKEDEHFRFALIIGGMTVTLGLAAMFGVSSLFAALTLGIATRWLETQRQGLSSIEFGASGDIFFIALFVMAGANLHVQDLGDIGLLAIVLAVVRSAAKHFSLHMSRRRSEHNARQTFAVSLMLLPMGGLAIGLAQTLQGFSPEMGSKVTAIVFAMVALLEMLGPFAVSAAIKLTGESPLFRPAPSAKEGEEESSEAVPEEKSKT